MLLTESGPTSKAIHVWALGPGVSPNGSEPGITRMPVVKSATVGIELGLVEKNKPTVVFSTGSGALTSTIGTQRYSVAVLNSSVAI